MASTIKIQPRVLVRASGGPRYAVALAVDALGTGLLRPFLLIYGVTVLGLSAPVTGTAMTVGAVAGLVCMPAVGRWLDRGARSTVVAASMLVRVLGVALLLAANVIYVFCLNVPEVAVPLVLVTQMDASPVWSGAVFAANTALVITLQVPVTVLLSRFPRRSVLVFAGVVLTASYLGFLAATSLGDGWGAPGVAAVSLVCTLGEIVYAGSATALVTALAPAHVLGRALARFQLSTGFGLAVSPAAITALASHGPSALWGGLATATLLSAGAVAADQGRGTRPGGSREQGPHPDRVRP
ncbi:hypothetical protein SAMN05443665_103724 [Actinomadura meyerae]|uniref:Major Facilitator Superfamily protein n=1 Tax=Actinomadura meyerae TaxID=240840 RepID=A0A239N9G3_9ACTN|nr:hypothetical protein [Actinomadura meyerae]SNT50858.1 hypothetical protein SAMN05443665_103724 [Actinomadura meyerae]